MAESFGRSRFPEVLSPAQANDKFTARLRGFGPIGILAILIILGGNFITPPLSAILVLIWVKISDAPWREIGYVRPRSWGKTIATGIVFGVALKFVMKAMVMPLFGAPPINQAYHFVTGNPAVIPMMIYTINYHRRFRRGNVLPRLDVRTIWQIARTKSVRKNRDRCHHLDFIRIGSLSGTRAS